MIPDPAFFPAHLLEQRVAETLQRAALDLARGQHRMDRLADVLRGRHAQDARLAGVEIDLDLDGAARVREHAVGVAAVAVVVPLDLRRLLVLALDSQRAALLEPAPGDAPEVVGVARRPLGEQLELLAHGARALLEQSPHDHDGARGDRGPAVGHAPGVGLLDRDELGGDAERLPHHLREHGDGALADLGVRDQDPRQTVGLEVDRRLRAESGLAAAGEARAVQHEREPDAAPHAPRRSGRRARLDASGPGAIPREATRPLLARRRRVRALVRAALGRPSHARRGALQHRVSPHALAQRLPGRRHVAGRVGVPATQRHRIHAQPVRDAVHLALDRVLGLRSPEPPERPVRRRVRGDGARHDRDVGTAIAAAGVDRATRQHDRRQRHIRAAVHHDIDLVRHERAVAHDAGAHPDHGRVPLRGRRDVLEPVVHDPHWPAALPRQQRGVPADHRRIFLLAAEAAPRDGLHDPHLGIRQRKRARQRLVHVVGTLQRSPHRKAAVSGALRQHAVVLDVQLLLVAAAVLALDDHVGAGKPGVEITARDRDRLHHVVVAVDDRLLRERLLDSEHRLLGLVLDADGPNRRFHALGVFVREEQDRLLRVPHLFHRQQRLIVLDQRDEVLAGDVLVIREDDARPVERRIELDPADAPARDRGAHGAPDECSRHMEVVQVERAAQDLVVGFELRDAAADGGRAQEHPRPDGARGRCSASHAAAYVGGGRLRKKTAGTDPGSARGNDGGQCSATVPSIRS